MCTSAPGGADVFFISIMDIPYGADARECMRMLPFSAFTRWLESWFGTLSPPRVSPVPDF